MKKIFFLLALTAGITGLMTTSCKSNTEKNDEAVENVNDANANLKGVQDDAIDDASKKATDAEWQTYKNEMLSAISAKEVRITDLKKKHLTNVEPSLMEECALNNCFITQYVFWKASLFTLSRDYKPNMHSLSL